MTLFKTSSELKAEVASLTADLESANGEIASLQTQLAEAQTELATARENLASAPTADQVAKLKADLETAQAAASEEAITAKAVEMVSADEPAEPVQKVIASRVTEALASAGHDKPIENAEENKSERKEMTREEFNKLNPAQKSAFSRNGGRITA